MNLWSSMGSLVVLRRSVEFLVDLRTSMGFFDGSPKIR